jgi:uncharacterized protein (TIGR01777 family)
MRVLVAGGTGFIGGHLVRALIARGDSVTVLTRNVESARRTLPRECRVAHWHPGKKGAWFEELPFVDGVVNLAGASIDKRWSDSYKRELRHSRVEVTSRLVEALAAAGESRARNAKTPSVLVNASGIGYYGSSTAGETTEDSEPGSDFLAKLCGEWEQAAQKAEEHGVRVVRLRIAAVLGKGGGVLARMIAPFGMFVAGPIGKGDNSLSWIHVHDVSGMIMWALDDANVRGAVNCTAPNFTSGKELACAMASVTDKCRIAVPEALVRSVLGELVDSATGSMKVYPGRAVDSGYAFHFARLVPALEQALMGEG